MSRANEIPKVFQGMSFGGQFVYPRHYTSLLRLTDSYFMSLDKN